MDAITLLDGAAPFYYHGSDVGCLLIHGLTSTPNEMRWLGQHLREQGFTIWGPRLAGHGTTPSDLARVTWREWYADVLAGYRMLRCECSRVFAMGQSMGGVLALLLAACEPVDGLVTLSAPYRVNDPRRPLLPLIGLFARTIPKDYNPETREAFQGRVMAEQTRRGEKPVGHVSYSLWPVPALRQFLALLEQLHARARDITAPALLIHSRADETVPIENLRYIWEAIGSQDKERLILERSGHVITEDCEHRAVFEAISAFVTARL